MADTDTINVIYVEGEEKPWRLDYKEVGVLKTARAALNYPVTKFNTEAEAVEVATMLRDIIHADQVEVVDKEGDVEILDDVQPAPFFKVVHRDKEETGVEKATEVVNGLTEEEIRQNQKAAGIPLDTDNVSLNPGPSQRQTEAELHADEAYTKADQLQARRVS